MHTNEIIIKLPNDLTNRFEGINLISFGSNSKTGDYDLFIFKESQNLIIEFYGIIREIKNILELIKESFPFKYQIFPFNLHRNFILKYKKIHILYYPNQVSFVYNELPSLLAYISKEGKVILGKNIPEKSFQFYKKRNPIIQELFEYHFLTYNNLVINYLIYYLSHSIFINNTDIKEKIIFSIKLSLYEILNEFYKNEGEPFPSWEFLIRFKDFSFANLARIDALHKRNTVDRSELKFLFKSYFDIYNHGIALLQNSKNKKEI